ncbi:hypothetical protein QR680_011761 [Steinernema hermaphroditum]|uniref:Uncharacterized protein n=1 Tax=Steinernema hermaphroditum TaxID=289476 RepID=A0AA39I1E6_9BILA|nr:hypothetical protein QR680_011761 [Steinernema hermaphroditum]
MLSAITICWCCGNTTGQSGRKHNKCEGEIRANLSSMKKKHTGNGINNSPALALKSIADATGLEIHQTHALAKYFWSRGVDFEGDVPLNLKIIDFGAACNAKYAEDAKDSDMIMAATLLYELATGGGKKVKDPKAKNPTTKNPMTKNPMTKNPMKATAKEEQR